jgi:LacI family transcriptional regulator
LCCNITVNNTLGGELVAQYFLEQGYQPCAYIGESFDIAPETNNSAKRLQGFQEGLHKHGIELPEAYIRLLPLTMENVMNGVIAQTHHLLDLPDPPEAIFTYSDLYAIGVLKAARSRNLSVPEDLALIGFDNIDVADFMELTTVDQHLEESGRLAIEVLLARIANPSQIVRNIELQAQIKTRGTA